VIRADLPERRPGTSRPVVARRHEVPNDCRPPVEFRRERARPVQFGSPQRDAVEPLVGQVFRVNPVVHPVDEAKLWSRRRGGVRVVTTRQSPPTASRGARRRSRGGRRSRRSAARPCRSLRPPRLDAAPVSEIDLDRDDRSREPAPKALRVPHPLCLSEAGPTLGQWQPHRGPSATTNSRR